MKVRDAVFVLGVLGLIAWSLQYDCARNHALDRLRVEADSLAQTVDSVTLASRERARADSIRLAYAQTRLRLAHTRYAANQSRTDTLLGIIIPGTGRNVVTDTQMGMPSDTLMGVILRLRLAIEAERRGAKQVIEAQDSIIATLRRGLLYWRDTVGSARETQLAIAQRLLSEALRAHQPALTCGPTLAVGISFKGLDAVGGYGCTLRLRLPF